MGVTNDGDPFWVSPANDEFSIKRNQVSHAKISSQWAFWTKRVRFVHQPPMIVLPKHWPSAKGPLVVDVPSQCILQMVGN